ncbi:MAG: hypothetical protein F7B59_04960 [Desulfurococcales archaeon]|nr:hypothetical protein [Desulfurococcales archaeon]
MEYIKIPVSEETLSLLNGLANKKEVSVEKIVTDLFKGIVNYLDEIESYANENSVGYDTAVSELMDYGVILWDEIISMILDVLHIDRQVVLDDLMFDHIDSTIILVLARTEGSEGLIDEITLDLSCEGTSLYAIHYLREGDEWKLSNLPEGFEPVFNRDEKAVILKTRGKTLEDLPTIGTLENLMGELIVKH